MGVYKADYKVPGGKMVRIQMELNGDRITNIRITGDFFLHPEEAIFELERALVGKRVREGEIGSVVEKALSKCQMVGISPMDLRSAIMKAGRGHKNPTSS